ncbi:MAG: hypothetical protein SNF86_03545 [Rikenellaceae bacterium]
MARRFLQFSLLAICVAAFSFFVSCDTSSDFLDGVGPPIENNDELLGDDLDENLFGEDEEEELEGEEGESEGEEGEGESEEGEEGEQEPEPEAELEPEVEEEQEPELGDDFLQYLPHVEDKRISNSYIANPMVAHGGVVRFVFPIVERINQYWGSSYDGYGNDPSKMIAAVGDSTWSCEVLWNDYGVNADISVEPTFDKNRIVVTTNGIAEANIVVGVRKGGTIVWSWHIWITDYNPDLIAEKNSVGAPYVYSASGANGELHRYDGAMSNVFVMDRNIGARSENDYSNMGQSDVPVGTLYYQFGRKDPFVGIGNKNGFLATSSTPWNPLNDNVGSAVTVRRAVESPMTYFSNVTSWSNDALSIDYLWNDAQKNYRSNAKSIFDPSPAGWRIPSGDLWSDFNGATLLWDYVAKVSTYAKSGAKYPAVGYRGYGGGLLTYVGALGNYWSSTPASVTNGMHLYSFGSGAVVSSAYRANAQPIRPIRE